jgi:hypothetical protein
MLFPDWPDRNVLPVLQGPMCTSAYFSASKGSMCQLEKVYAADPALLCDLLNNVVEDP